MLPPPRAAAAPGRLLPLAGGIAHAEDNDDPLVIVDFEFHGQWSVDEYALPTVARFTLVKRVGLKGGIDAL